MPTYKFEALDSTGFEVKDSILALSEEDAQEKIRQLGYFVTRITEVNPNVDSMNEFELALDEGDSQLEPKDIFESDFEMPALGESGSAQAAHDGGRKIGEVLVDLGYLDEDQLWEILAEVKNTNQLTGQVAVARGLITEEQLLAALAEQHNLQVISLDGVKPTAEALQAVRETMASVYKILPLTYRDGILTIVLSDPRNLAALDDLRNLLGCEEVRAHMASPQAVADAWARAYGKEDILDIIKALEADLPPQRESKIDLGILTEIQDADPVPKLVNMVMLMAIRDKASDIHFEPFEDEYMLRYRCDGTLYELVPPPRHLAPKIVDRIKVMANLDTAERRLPQHGRIDLDVGGNPVPMRVSVLPTMSGENIALRVLDRTVVGLDLDRIGLDPALLARFREIIHEPNGIVLVTGPLGAGKTATLYSALNELNEITGKIITVEDPVEYEIDGIVHCRTHDLASADAVRFILGQGPDIIVVGEIRDQETAQFAVQAALSGRLVLGTLAAADAASSITRLRGMGLAPSLIAATVKSILAQRLVRKICGNCRTEFEPTPEIMMELHLRPADAKGKKFCYGMGCDRCNNIGQKGRMGIFELFVMNHELRDAISSGASTDQLRTACGGQGMPTLREAGLKAIFDGVTTIDEVVRETMLEDRIPMPP